MEHERTVSCILTSCFLIWIVVQTTISDKYMQSNRVYSNKVEINKCVDQIQTDTFHHNWRGRRRNRGRRQRRTRKCAFLFYLNKFGETLSTQNAVQIIMHACWRHLVVKSDQCMCNRQGLKECECLKDKPSWLCFSLVPEGLYLFECTKGGSRTFYLV